MTLPFDYTLRHSDRRRTIGLEVNKGQVIVRAPRAIPQANVLALLQARVPWVLDKLARQRKRLAEIPERRYHAGESLPFCGESLSLVIERATRANIERAGTALRVVLSTRSRLNDTEQARRLVEQWYRTEALNLLAAKSHALAERMGLRVANVKVRATRSKWGHCTHRGELQYNWHILLAPASVIDYLVAHEVCHLRHPNHSKAYWQCVASVCPNYRAERDWLKTQGHTLVL
ncbi:M48 family metallopeptidase [Marinimicrobium alkaliphilum]|uniref:M48 family metallopeptidase n=1 Tax=Marinimicrobium alkaliphilum TaxID=2202654 RepID=UPI000DB9C371|nr:SprT family zinc-dependent metalloprotease [Marinimicrobium alkaliphilum]